MQKQLYICIQRCIPRKSHTTNMYILTYMCIRIITGMHTEVYTSHRVLVSVMHAKRICLMHVRTHLGMTVYIQILFTILHVHMHVPCTDI